MSSIPSPCSGELLFVTPFSSTLSLRSADFSVSRSTSQISTYLLLILGFFPVNDVSPVGTEIKAGKILKHQTSHPAISHPTDTHSKDRGWLAADGRPLAAHAGSYVMVGQWEQANTRRTPSHLSAPSAGEMGDGSCKINPHAYAAAPVCWVAVGSWGVGVSCLCAQPFSSPCSQSWLGLAVGREV